MYISNNELDQINYCDMKENKINQINQSTRDIALDGKGREGRDNMQ